MWKSLMTANQLCTARIAHLNSTIQKDMSQQDWLAPFVACGCYQRRNPPQAFSINSYEKNASMYAEATSGLSTWRIFSYNSSRASQILFAPICSCVLQAHQQCVKFAIISQKWINHASNSQSNQIILFPRKNSFWSGSSAKSCYGQLDWADEPCTRRLGRQQNKGKKQYIICSI